MNTLTGATLGGILGAISDVKIGDLSKPQKIAILALAGAVLVNLHKNRVKNQLGSSPSIEAYKYRDERRA